MKCDHFRPFKQKCVIFKTNIQVSWLITFLLDMIEQNQLQFLYQHLKLYQWTKFDNFFNLASLVKCDHIRHFKQKCVIFKTNTQVWWRITFLLHLIEQNQLHFRNQHTKLYQWTNLDNFVNLASLVKMRPFPSVFATLQYRQTPPSVDFHRHPTTSDSTEEIPRRAAPGGV